MVETDVNKKVKKANVVDGILKSDLAKYDPYKLLHYDLKLYRFLPKIGLEQSEKERVKKMILTLGLNYDPIVERRRIFLEEKLLDINIGLKTWNDFKKVEQFPTAFEMCKKQDR